MKLSKIILAFSFIIIRFAAQAQVGIGTNSPAASAQLDVSSTNKGLLIPQVALSGSTDAVTISSPAVSLLVYNTAVNSDVVKGYYYNSGTSTSPVWLRLTTGASGVPYSGASGAVNLGSYDLTVNDMTIGKGLAAVATNTALGYRSLYANWFSGNNNTALGYNTLKANTTGIQNTAVGANALTANVGGQYNTALGYNTLSANTSGNQNIAFGADALSKNVSGQFNTALGSYTLNSNLASYNIAVGNKSLYTNTNGTYNTSIGNASLNFNLNGANNTGVGYRSLYTNKNGNNNTAIGYYADVASDSLTNAMAIGYNAKVNANNTIQLGNSSVTDIKTNAAITASGKVVAGAATPYTNSAVLEANSTNQGFLPPRLTYDQKNAIVNPVGGLMVWCTDCGTNGEMQVFNGSSWINISGTSASGTVSTLASAPIATPANDVKNLGIYKGVFVGSSGYIQINLNNTGNGVISAIAIIDGKRLDFTTSQTITQGQATSILFANGNNSFIFSVDANGENPTFSSVTFPSHSQPVISVLKETSTSLVTCMEGSFDGVTDRGTWNLIITGTKAAGIFYSYQSQDNYKLNGTVDSNGNISLTSTALGFSTNNKNFVGTINGANSSGTWTSLDGTKNGTWLATRTL